MPSMLPILECCCECDEQGSAPLPIPGPPGPEGPSGLNGIDGKNAYTVTTASFTVPAVNGSVTVEVADTDFLALGQNIFIEHAGLYSVVNKVSATEVTVKNLGDASNLPPGSAVPVGSRVNTSGDTGPQGPPGPTNGVYAVTNISELKALPSNAARKLVFVNFPEPSYSSAYKALFGDATPVSEPAVLSSNDGATRYFEHTGIS